MTLQDISNGPNWIMWVAVLIFIIITIILLSEHGVNLIVGYNSAECVPKTNINNIR